MVRGERYGKEKDSTGRKRTVRESPVRDETKKSIFGWDGMNVARCLEANGVDGRHKNIIAYRTGETFKKILLS